MPFYKLRWIENHSAIVEADNIEEAEEKVMDSIDEYDSYHSAELESIFEVDENGTEKGGEKS